MSKSEILKKPSPRLTASLTSKLFYCWLIPFFLYGNKNDIEPSNIYDTPPNYRSEQLANRLERFWKDEVKEAKKCKRKPSLLKALIKDNGPTFALYAFLSLADHLCRTAQPFFVIKFISYFEKNSTISNAEAYMYFMAYTILTFIYLLSANKLFRDMRNMGMCIRVACSSLIYRKTLRLPQASSDRTSAGKVINLLSNDVTKFEQNLMFLHNLWAVPVQVIAISYIICSHIGFAALAGVFTSVALSIPLQLQFGKLIGIYRRKIASYADERIMLMSEIINGIRVIKMYTWEGPFEKIISVLRSYELNTITKAVFINSILGTLIDFAQRASLFVAILAISIFSASYISTAQLFILFQYFNLLHISLNVYFLKAITFNSITLASIKRIQDFLLCDEMNIEAENSNPFKINDTKNKLVKTKDYNPFESDEKINNSPFESNDSNSKSTNPFEEIEMISIENVNASWTGSENSLCLNNINITFSCDKLYAICGSVGAGKSSLLKLLLQELKPIRGIVEIFGSISYASQEPWLFPGSIRSNILFGASYDKEKYRRVTNACALFDDFLQLPSGDKTLVGDNGENLSGGQRARVNLARAVYRDADIYLLDDPLSSVDTKVCKKIYDMCIKNLLKNKTCLLVTHQLHCIKDADEIILMNGGQVEFQGTYTNLRNTKELLEKAIFQDFSEVSNVDNHEKKHTVDKSNYLFPEKEIEFDETSKLTMEEGQELKSIEDLREVDEAKAKKRIPLSLYLKYFKSGNSYWFLLLILASFIVAQTLNVGSDCYLAYWISTIEAQHSSNPQEYINRWTGLGIMGLLLTCIIIFSVIKLMLLGKMFVKASENIHSKMISRLLRATVSFFDKNNSGRVLNRFSKDLGIVDEVFPPMFSESWVAAFILIGVVAQVIIINWKIIFPAIILLYILRKFLIVMLSIIQDLRRIEGNAKSPVLAHTNSTISGLITIRSANALKVVQQQFDTLQDYHTSAYSMTDDSVMFLSLCGDLMTIFFLFIVTLTFLIFKNDNVPGAMIGLAICQLIFICGCLQKVMRIYAEISMQMVAVERLFQYTKLEQERSAHQKLPDSWPVEGQIDFKMLSLKYSDESEPVLKNLDFSIEPGAKVGIVGRTGAGKSSLVAALFRFANLDGSLMIDEVDIEKIDLTDLRKKISILPQEPILFSLSLRENLDPYKRTKDHILWSALDDVEMKNVFDSLDKKLDFSNMSSGQRQLLCLARIILNSNKIVIFDEATANIDDKTDELIQRTIKKKCKNCTVLTIAHRLNTIIDSDKVIVMETGRVIEYDHPHLLLQKKDGYFSKMVELAGDETSKALKKLAEEHFKLKNLSKIVDMNENKIKNEVSS